MDKKLQQQLSTDIQTIFEGCELSSMSQYEKRQAIFSHLSNTMSYNFGLLETIHNIEVNKARIKRDPVEELNSAVFDHLGICNSITTIVIPDTVTVIGTGETVFEACASLKNIVFPSGAVSVGNYAFEKCKNLTKINLPNSLEVIDNNVVSIEYMQHNKMSPTTKQKSSSRRKTSMSRIS